MPRTPATVGLMRPSNLHARRATVDDLVELRRLWRAAGIGGPDMEKQFKAFQVVATPEGLLLGALALHIHGTQAWLQAETYAQPEMETESRHRLWERVQTLARNHGLYRLWTDHPAPFWKAQGFEPVRPDQLRQLPTPWADPARTWLVLQLREEAPAATSLEYEFDLFTRAQRESRDRLIRQARTFKNFAYVILTSVVVLGFVLLLIAVLPGSTRARFFRSKSVPALPGGTSPATNGTDRISPETNPAPAKAIP